MNRTRKFLYNSFFAACYELVILLAGFITPKIMLNIYGSEINGLISSISQFIVYFNLVEAGLSGAAIFALYKPLADGNHEKISGIVVATQKLYTQSGWIFTILVLGLALAYPVFIPTNVMSNVKVFLLILVLGFSGILEFFTLGKYRALLTASQELYVISISSIIYQIVFVCIMLVLSIAGCDILTVRIVALSAVSIRSIILILYTKKKHPYINYKAIPIKKDLNKRWDALYLQILGAIRNGAPIILATCFTDLIQVSIFTVYNLIVSGIAGLTGIFTNGLSASFGEIIAKKEDGLLKKTYSEFETAFYLISVILFGVSVIMILPFVNLYTKGVHDANYSDNLLAFLIVLNSFFYSLQTPQGMMIISAGHYKETRVQVTIQGAIAIFIGVILAPKFGLYGILCASILSNLYRMIDLIFYVPKKIVNNQWYFTMGRMGMACIEFFICVLLALYLPTEIYCWWDWIKMATIVTFVVSAMAISTTFIFDSKNMRNLINRFAWKK